LGNSSRKYWRELFTRLDWFGADSINIFVSKLILSLRSLVFHASSDMTSSRSIRFEFTMRHCRYRLHHTAHSTRIVKVRWSRFASDFSKYVCEMPVHYIRYGRSGTDYQWICAILTGAWVDCKRCDIHAIWWAAEWSHSLIDATIAEMKSQILFKAFGLLRGVWLS